MHAFVFFKFPAVAVGFCLSLPPSPVGFAMLRTCRLGHLIMVCDDICTCHNLAIFFNLLLPDLEHQGLKLVHPYHCVLTMRYSLLAAFVALLLRSFLARRVPFPTLWLYVPCIVLVPALPFYLVARFWRRVRAGGAGCRGTLCRSSPYP